MRMQKAMGWGSALAQAVVLAMALHSGAATARSAELFDAPKVVFASAYVPSEAQVRERIIMAGQSLGWAVTRDAPGTLELQYDKQGKHQVAIAVRYDHTGYKIDYLSSYNLNYAEVGGGRQIHPNYNRWIRNLIQRISGT